RVNLAMGEALERAASAWPQRLSTRELLGASGFTAVCADALLRRVLESTTIRHVGLERLLTSFRLEFLHAAANRTNADGFADDVLDFCAALAKQCFINEYIFATTAEEAEQAQVLARMLL